MDLKDYLMNHKHPTIEKQQEKRQKKIITKSIFNPNKHLVDLFQQLDDESLRITHCSWNRLEKGIKYKKIMDFLETYKSMYNIPSNLYEKNIEYILHLYKHGDLNKLSDVEYDSDTATIISIPILEFNESTLLFSKIT
jgi:hypothetical protein